MVPDIPPREIVALAWVHPGNWSLITTKEALVCPFQNAPYPLDFLFIRFLTISIERGGILIPLLPHVGRVQRFVMLQLTQSLRLLSIQLK